MGLEGRLVGGRYRLLRRAGSGRSGTVWRALDEAADREVAVRWPRLPGVPEGETYRRAAHRLYREARAAARVDHPAAVRILDVVVEDAGLDGLPWIVMEWVQGESLHEVLRRGPVPPAEAARIGLAVLGALRAAHAVGIVHRAVRPANVLLGRHDRVVLTDFGTAHLPGEGAAPPQQGVLPEQGAPPGEGPPPGQRFRAGEDFRAEEEFRAGKESPRDTGPAADLRSLGALLRAAAGDPPASGPSGLSRPPESPVRPGSAGPSGLLGTVVERLLAEHAALRPDAEDVAQQLEAVAGGLRPTPDVKEVIRSSPSV
ncbi:serine/threonine-protein kinase [Streptomyces sp. NPDC057245]|uniref:serine/threonine-protein kinase n=1 Tax=Streptomyces TaxID=1883 RepID=UPI001C1E8871|nr:serine/threonine-protein kinase [Streptomyces sp. A108]MBU6532656.1 serine/threonine protein kinase [Streptomyces sp. A108]